MKLKTEINQEPPDLRLDRKKIDKFQAYQPIFTRVR